MKETVDEYHIPVLYYETLDNLVINPDGVYVDCTLGGGGHSEGILKRLSPKGVLISIDQDQQAIDYAKKRLEGYGNWKCFKNNFENIETVIYMAGYDKVDGILMDIGVSSTQLDDAERGFSYRFDARLDMRMNTSAKISAYEVVNTYEEGALSKILFEYGEERHARRIAKFICDSRKEKPIETTGDLVAIIKRAYPERASKHPAKKTFQAIRIEVNKELEVLENAINKAVDCLKVGGRLGIITFHSLEDRIVKTMFKDFSTDCICPPRLPVCICDNKAKVKLITKKPIIPSEDELTHNKRAHSSKLRVIERI
ncbi:MAG: 16S rRNA (cytosine(1402)-N(4))-methyltransferase RsmH [Fusobacteriaceae bacterium]|nr:16S rRNA (cytosine(1402)-N(4))-methyltransferase RsmH [Fusobacteriaceae bacterium]